VTVQDSKGGLTTSSYDGANQLTQRQFTGNGGTLRIDYGYTDRGELSTTTRYLSPAEFWSQLLPN
jgi:hypothetical protein